MLANQIQSCIKYTMTKLYCLRNVWLATLKKSINIVYQIIIEEKSYDFSRAPEYAYDKIKYPFTMKSIHYENSYQTRNKRELP